MFFQYVIKLARVRQMSVKVGRHVAQLMQLPRSLRERKHYKRVFLGKYYDKKLRVPHAALLFGSLRYTS